jgi:hypothetical protein
MDRHNKFANDYVKHLPEIGPHELSQGGLVHMVCYHDDWCNIYNVGGSCNCNPMIKYHAEPRRQ